MRKVVAALFLILGFAESARAEFVKVSDDLVIHYLTAGSGSQVILLVPGWTMSSAVFEKQLKHFDGSKTYKVIAMDPRSQGLSSHTSEGNFYEQHGRDLNAFMHALNLKGVVLAGWSYGGFDVLAYVHQYGSSNLKGLILLDAAPKGMGEDDSAESKEWVWYRRDDSDHFREYYTQHPLLDRQKFNDEFAKAIVDHTTPEYIAWISDMMSETSDEVAALLNESGAYQDYDADLRNLDGKIPLLFYVHSEWQAVNNWSEENTPSATIVRFGKHLSFWEHPEKFNAILDGFLARQQ